MDCGETYSSTRVRIIAQNREANSQAS
jgi:hypothetical protein